MKICLIFLLFINIYNAEPADIDSLKNIASDKNLQNETRLEACYKIGEEYLHVNPDSSLYYSYLILDSFDLEKNRDYLYKVNSLAGEANYYKADYDKALNFFQKAALTLEKTDHRNLAESYNNIGNVYYNLYNFTKAEEYFRKALKSAERSDHTLIKPPIYNNISKILRKKNKLDSSEYYLNMALRLDIKDKKKLKRVYLNLSHVNHLQGHIDYALQFADSALKYSKEDYFIYLQAYTLKADILKHHTDDLTKTVNIYLEAAQIARDKNYKHILHDIYKNLYELYHNNEEYDTSMKYYEKAASLRDTLSMHSDKEIISKIQSIYNRKLKEKEIKALKSENKFNRMIVIFISVIFLVILFSGIIYYRNKNKAFKKTLELKEELENKNYTLNKKNKENKEFLEKLNSYKEELEIQNDELRVSEIKLDESRQKYENLFDQAPIGYVTLDKDFIINNINHKVLEYLQLTKQEVYGKYFGDLIHEDDASKFYFFKRDLIQNKKSGSDEFQIECCKDEIKFFIIQCRVFFDRNADEEMVFMNISDITEKKKLENELLKVNKNLENLVRDRTRSLEDSLQIQEQTKDALAKSEEFIRKFTNRLPVGIYRTDSEGNLIYANEKLKDILGIGDDIENINVRDFYVDKSIRKEIINKLDDKEEKYEIQLHTFKSQKIWVRDSITKYTHEDNNIFFDGVIEDITGEKRAEEKLQMVNNQLLIAKEKAEETSKVKSIILGNLGHELRTPLNGILGFTQLLKDTVKNPDDLEMLEMIYESAKRLNKTLNSLLSISEVEEVTNLNPEEMDICNIAKYLLEQFEQDAKSKDISLQLTGKDLIAFTDEFMLQQILYNLIDNAVKYTNKGYVAVEFEELKDHIAVMVKDTGVGISKDKIKTIFEAFRQGSEGLDRKFEGVGIGLTITRKIVDLINARITVESELNEGTTFTVYLPKNEEIYKNNN